MSPEQEKDLEYLHFIHKEMLDKKYRDGAKKHGNDLLTMTTEEALVEALAENLDQFVYIMKGLGSLYEDKR